ncbi:hypothetical protein [Ilumatobacter sp.]|uniref:hypothetical protein n=1 Tax=Ilumatobacter sp. TaxID=1967498 RepID=UPI003B530304
MLAIPIIGDVFDFITTPFRAAAGWAWDTVVEGITNWVMNGVLTLLMAVWNFLDTSSTPQLDSAWFSGDESAPFRVATWLGVLMLSVLLLLAVIRAVSAGSPGQVIQAVGRDLPVAVFAMASLIAVTAAAIRVADGFSDYVWARTRPQAAEALSNVAEVLMSTGTSLFFLGPLIGIALIIAMLFMWIVLLVRTSLIYLVVIYAVAFGLPSMLFPPLRDTAKKVLELLAALVLAKPIIVLAVSVGANMLAALGDAGEPGAGVGDNAAREIGVLIVGVIVFGLAAFMPFVLWKLMPLIAAAVVAQGIASAPMRAATQGMQMQYYGRQVTGRLAGSGSRGGAQATGSSGAAAGLGGAGPAGAGTSSLASGGASTAGGGAATAASGPAAPVVGAAVATKAAADGARSSVTSAVSTMGRSSDSVAVGTSSPRRSGADSGGSGVEGRDG